MRQIFPRAVFSVALVVLATAAAAAERAIIVLDASGSMWGQIDGRPKLEIAREALRTVLQSVPADTELGLMAYGHREKGSCTDIELVVPPAAGTGAAIATAADKMQFLGKTPLSAAVRQAAEALRSTEEKATVILITDGLETCNADPCALGTELEQSGVDFTAHVVGFGLSDEEGKQVACLADNSGGKYFEADDAEGLQDALAEAVAPEPEPAPAPEPEPDPQPEFNFEPEVTLSEGGPLLARTDGNAWEIARANADGTAGEHVATEYGGAYKANLEPGDYVVKARLGAASVAQPVKVEAGKVAKPHFVLNAGKLTIRPLTSPGAEPSDSAAVFIDHPGENDVTTYGVSPQFVPAGEQKVTVTLGRGSVTETLRLEAGQSLEKDIVIGVGRVTANVLYAPGVNVDAGQFVEFFAAAKEMDGTRQSFGYGYGPGVSEDLPAGDYVARATLGAASAEAPFSVKVSELTEVSVVLDAGVLAITAPGGTFIEIFGAKDIAGNSKEFGNAYGDSFQTTLPAGEYTVSVTRGDDKKEAKATVKAGERSEITVQ